MTLVALVVAAGALTGWLALDRPDQSGHTPEVGEDGTYSVGSKPRPRA